MMARYRRTAQTPKHQHGSASPLDMSDHTPTHPSRSSASSPESIGRRAIGIHPSGFANSTKRTYRVVRKSTTGLIRDIEAIHFLEIMDACSRPDGDLGRGIRVVSRMRSLHRDCLFQSRSVAYQSETNRIFTEMKTRFGNDRSMRWGCGPSDLVPTTSSARPERSYKRGSGMMENEIHTARRCCRCYRGGCRLRTRICGSRRSIARGDPIQAGRLGGYGRIISCDAKGERQTAIHVGVHPRRIGTLRNPLGGVRPESTLCVAGEMRSIESSEH